MPEPGSMRIVSSINLDERNNITRFTMKLLCLRVRTVVEGTRESREEDEVHSAVCTQIADEYNLWDGDGLGAMHFPTWLCYIVDGIMRNGYEP